MAIPTDDAEFRAYLLKLLADADMSRAVHLRSDVVNKNNRFTQHHTTDSLLAALGSIADFTLEGDIELAVGSVIITPSAANTPTAVGITFPVGFFSSPPKVFVTPDTDFPGTRVTGTSVGSGSISEAGCDIVLTRTDTTDTDVFWLAINSDSGTLKIKDSTKNFDPAIDSIVAHGSIPTSGTSTWSHTVAEATKSLLIVIAQSVGNPAFTSTDPTFAGIPMTLASRAQSGTNCGSEIWVLEDPPSGTNNVVFTANGQNSIDVTSISVINADTFSNPGSEAGSGGPVHSVSVTEGTTDKGLMFGVAVCLAQNFATAAGNLLVPYTGYVGSECRIDLQTGDGTNITMTYTTSPNGNMSLATICVP